MVPIRKQHLSWSQSQYSQLSWFYWEYIPVSWSHPGHGCSVDTIYNTIHRLIARTLTPNPNITRMNRDVWCIFITSGGTYPRVLMNPQTLPSAYRETMSPIWRKAAESSISPIVTFALAGSPAKEGFVNFYLGLGGQWPWHDVPTKPLSLSR